MFEEEKEEHIGKSLERETRGKLLSSKAGVIREDQILTNLKNLGGFLLMARVWNNWRWLVEETKNLLLFMWLQE